ncbi:helix-turn-helix transcriptional regulator [Azospirillum rugosum]|uniref:DNA-binding XRE family transcriptional regulator n=1 Tax=Azospirillum rugosum TaxID=416170 RepID=A0ABS4SX36_9PROT|nr:helix-turn-helix transcriptional regulator [Azospirillum rugosum]MBP2297116.1 DNA-binding XRE family transcriptional regulator [Azospirillum rugosum]MDQ0530918.1 DNA-binding XRE family transcriptional regulator [Azospirillum rugosum]
MTEEIKKLRPPRKPHKQRTRIEDAPPELLTFVSNFKKARLEAGLSQNDIMRLTGISQTYISFLERSFHSPSLSYMALLARVVGKPLHELLEP